MKPINRTRIKMCGVTRRQDALCAVNQGVDALGFIFYEKSPRNIDPEDARLIIEELPPLVDRVGVFVNKKRKEVEEIIHYCGLSLVQLHGEESLKYCERLTRSAVPCQVIKALRMRPELTAEEAAQYSPFVRGFLLDTYHENQAGGTGKTFDWKRVKALKLERPFLLAGGLNPANVVDALEGVGPYGLDVNSGVESAPGIKDHDLIRQFVQTVRGYEAKQFCLVNP